MATPLPGPLADKTDAELLYLAQHAARYPAAIGAAAVQELQRRGLIPEELPDTAQPRPASAAPAPDTHWLEQAAQVVRAMLWPRPGYRVTPWLLNANLVVFLLMGLSGVHLLAPAGEALVAWGSNVSSLTPQQPWRLLTSVFLHGGPAHLLLNMSALLLLGLMAESKAGHWRWLLIYLLSGIGGSLTSLWWHTQGVNSVGASGAIFGLYGLLLALLLTQRTALSRQERAGMLGLLLYFALSSLVGGLEGPAGTDNAAHIGGLLTGLVAGLGSTLAGRAK